MGENLYLACKRGRNQSVWERLGWRLFHQVIKKVPIAIPFWHVIEILKHQDPGRLNLCLRPWHKVMIHHPLQNIAIVIDHQACCVLERCKRLGLRAFLGWVGGTRETSDGCRRLHGLAIIVTSSFRTPSSSLSDVRANIIIKSDYEELTMIQQH